MPQWARDNRHTDPKNGNIREKSRHSHVHPADEVEKRSHRQKSFLDNKTIYTFVTAALARIRSEPAETMLYRLNDREIHPPNCRVVIMICRACLIEKSYTCYVYHELKSYGQ